MYSENPTYRSGVTLNTIDLLKQSKELMGSDYLLFVGICAVAAIIGYAVPFNLLLGPMLCGTYLAFATKMRNEPVKFELLFKGFDYLKDSLIAALIQLAAMLVALIPGIVIFFVISLLIGLAFDDSGFGGLLFLFIYFLFYLATIAALITVHVCTMFAFPLILEHKMDGMAAIKLSFHAGKANLKALLIYGFVISIASFVASALCFLPIFLFLPIMFGANYLIYRKIFIDSADQVVPPQPTMPTMDPPPPPPTMPTMDPPPPPSTFE